MPEQPYIANGADPGLTPLPSGQAPLRTADAMMRLGSATIDLGARLQEAQQQTLMANGTTRILTGINAARDNQMRSTDYANAPGQFQRDAQSVVDGTVADLAKQGLSPVGQAQLRERSVRARDWAGNAVQGHAWGLEASQNVGNLDAQDQQYQQSYLGAGSDVQRAAVVDQQKQAVAAAAQAGWITPQDAQRRISNFAASADDARLRTMISNDPAQAKALLDDPKNFSAMNPVQRANLADAAARATDAHTLAHLGTVAQANPAAAIGALGTASNPYAVQQVYDRGVIQQESGGNPNVGLSTAGAAGVSQMMPGTARMVAADLAKTAPDGPWHQRLTAIAGMSDPQVRATLRSDPGFAHQLGLSYFTSLVNRYGGQLAPAFAAYHAGPGAVDGAVARAKAQFGDSYTPDQFLSVFDPNIGDGSITTANYVRQIFGRLGASTAGLGLTTQAARDRAGATLDAQMRRDGNAQQSILARQASFDQGMDPLAGLMEQGVAVDPARVASRRQELSAAAAGGDAKAAEGVRRLDYAQSIQPQVQAAYGMNPAQLASTVAAMGQSLRANPAATQLDLDRFNAFSHVLAAVQKGVKTDPVGLGERAGLFRAEPAPDLTQPGATSGWAFRDFLGTRSAQAMTAATAYGSEPMPFHPAEAQQIKGLYDAAGPSSKAAMLASLYADMDPKAADAAVSQIAGGDRMAAAIGRMAADRPALAAKVLQGEQLLQGPGMKPKAADVKSALADAFGGQIYPSPGQQTDAERMSLAVYAADRSADQSSFDKSDAAGIRSAIEEVTGKIAPLNGLRTPMPPGLSESVTASALQHATAEDWAKAGAPLAPGVSPAFAATANFTPLRVGGSHYSVTWRGQPLQGKDGQPLVVDLKALNGTIMARGGDTTTQGQIDQMVPGL